MSKMIQSDFFKMEKKLNGSHLYIFDLKFMVGFYLRAEDED